MTGTWPFAFASLRGPQIPVKGIYAISMPVPDALTLLFDLLQGLPLRTQMKKYRIGIVGASCEYCDHMIIRGPVPGSLA